MEREIDWKHVTEAFEKRTEIKAKKAELEDLDKQIVEWLDKELDVLKDIGTTQVFYGPNFRVSAKVPQGLKVDEVKVTELLNENENLQVYADMFAYKMSVKDGAWNKAPEEVKQAFSDAITTTPGKTTYEIKFN